MCIPVYQLYLRRRGYSIFFYFPRSLLWQGGRVAQWLRSLDLTTHTSLSPLRRGFVPSFVNYKKGALDLRFLFATIRIWFYFIWFLVLNATFNNISAILWRPVLVMEKAEYRERNTDHGQVTGKLAAANRVVNYEKRCTRFAAASLPVTCPWSVFLSRYSAFSITKTGRHNIAEILLKVALKHQKSINLIVLFRGERRQKLTIVWSPTVNVYKRAMIMVYLCLTNIHGDQF
jgi:hypothetical protein